MEAPRIPSFFKSRRAKEFRYKPWFYDPVKEDIQNRTEKIKAELERREKENSDPEGFESRIAGSFGNNSSYKESSSGMLRFTIMVVLFFGTIGYLYLGNVVLYTLIGLLVLIYFLRKRQIL